MELIAIVALGSFMFLVVLICLLTEVPPEIITIIGLAFFALLVVVVCLLLATT